MSRYYGIGSVNQHIIDDEMELRERRPLLNTIELDDNYDPKMKTNIRSNRYNPFKGNMSTKTKIAVGAGAVTGGAILAGVAADAISTKIHNDFYNSPRGKYMESRGYTYGTWTMQDWHNERTKDVSVRGEWNRIHDKYIDIMMNIKTSKEKNEWEEFFTEETGHEGWFKKYPHMGPGNKIKESALNELDNIAREHDIAYKNAITDADVYEADKIFLSAIDKYKSTSWTDSGIKLLAKTGINLKTSVEQTLDKVLYPPGLVKTTG